LACDYNGSERVRKEILEIKSADRRKLERQRLRWVKVVENYLQKLKLKRWGEMANNRAEWASTVEETKALRDQYSKGVSRQVMINKINIKILRQLC
jgi:hypothetical protein